MTKRVLTGILLLISVVTMIHALEWDEDHPITVIITFNLDDPYGMKYLRTTFCGNSKLVYDHYNEKYGEKPKFIDWEDGTTTIATTYTFGFRSGPTSNMDVPKIYYTFSDIKDYIYLMYHETGDTTSKNFSTISVIQDTQIVGTNWGGTNRTFYYNLNELPIPKNKKTYVYYFEYHSDGKTSSAPLWRSDSLFTAARSPVEDAMDSLLWARNYEHLDEEMVETLLETFPTYNYLLWLKLNYCFKNDSSCVVIRETASRLMNVYQNNSDPFQELQRKPDPNAPKVRVTIDGEPRGKLDEIGYLQYIIENCKRPPRRQFLREEEK